VIEPFEVRSGPYRIRGLLTLPEGDGKHPCVVLSHGLISSKESSKYRALSAAFLSSGVASCRFDYRGCGESEGRIEETTLSQRVEDLDAVVDWVFQCPSLDHGRIGLLGSSFGGCTSLVKAARDPRITCISLWATPHLLEKKEESPPPEITFNDSLYEDFAGYDLLAEAEKVARALVIHGEMDEVVPAHEGKAIYRRLKRPKKWELIAGGDHVLSVPGHRERAIALSSSWFSRFFS
jgi:dipeptidyl aminopeptidase/acylaminoacyl peptidase